MSVCAGVIHACVLFVILSALESRFAHMMSSAETLGRNNAETSSNCKVDSSVSECV